MRKSVIQKPALDLLEESVALLRECSPGVLSLYYIGAIPFVLGFLFFWTDMSRGAFARDHVAEASLQVALAFLWCKCWQSLFCVHLLAVASRQKLPPWTWRRLWRVACAQAALQPTGLIVLPIAALITLPLGYTYAFYQNVSILALDGAGEPLEAKRLRREALTAARRWPMQNHFGLAVLILFGLIVFINIFILVMALPFLLRTLLGIETMLSRGFGGASMFNSTLFGSVMAITYLCVDPLFKAFYTLRCFHGRSLATGHDLRIRLRAAIAPVGAAALILVLCNGSAARAALSPSPAASAAANSLGAKSEQIDQSITKVLSKPEFAWRMPRVETQSGGDAASNGFVRGVAHMLRRMGRALKKPLAKLGRWIERLMIRNETQHEDVSPGSARNWGFILRVFAWIFCGAAAIALIIIGIKLWLGRTRPAKAIAQPLRARPDLTAEDVTADQMAGDEWLNLAREMMERGDLRLALRAIYLAALAHLGERRFISIARYKSNREYQRELQRRRPGETDLNATFADTVLSFERSWYGMHEVTWDILNATRANLERIRAC
ncbi:MAG TPA: DUF4129 domain-containing protein [Chthoniobacteraceae bacterium]|jgi:hypothetical protein|nr:DUF4129 domain-containing protein [Chthoniobacteraceae bacterium]